MNFLEHISFEALLDFIFDSLDSTINNDEAISNNILNEFCYNSNDTFIKGGMPSVYFKSFFDDDKNTFSFSLDIHNSEYGMKLETENLSDEYDSYNGDLLISFYDKSKKVAELNFLGFSFCLGDKFDTERIILKDNDTDILDLEELVNFDIMNLSFNGLYGSIIKNEYREFMFDVTTYDDKMNAVNDFINICDDYELYFDYVYKILTMIHDNVLLNSFGNKHDIFAFIFEKILTDYISDISSKNLIIKYLRKSSDDLLNSCYDDLIKDNVKDFSFDDKDVPKVLKRCLNYNLKARQLELKDEDDEDYGDEFDDED